MKKWPLAWAATELTLARPTRRFSSPALPVPPVAQWVSAAAMSLLIPPASSGMSPDGQFHRCRRWRYRVVNAVAPDAAAHRAASPVNRSSWRRTGWLATRLILLPARPARTGNSPGDTAANCAHGRTWWGGTAECDDVAPPHPAMPRATTANAAATARSLANALTLPANCIPGARRQQGSRAAGTFGVVRAVDRAWSKSRGSLTMR